MSVVMPPTTPPNTRRESSRAQGLGLYVGRLRDAGDISHSTAERALVAWDVLSAAAQENLCVPDAAPGPDGQLLLAWDRAEHHLELEVFPDGPAEFFYLNRDSGRTWEDEFAAPPVSQGVREKLSLFTTAHG